MTELLRLIMLSLCIGLLPFGCKKGTFAGQTKTTGGKDKNAVTDGGKRPTDEDEAIEGYLTDPDLVTQSNKDSGGSVITGKAGAVAAENGPVTMVNVGVWSIEQRNLDEFDSQQNLLPAKLMECGKANSNGSFSLSVPGLLAQHSAVTAGLSCTRSELPIDRQNSRLRVIIGGGEGGFVSSARFFPRKDCTCPAGQRYDHAVHGCVERSKDVEVSCDQDSPIVCGCDNVNYRNACEAEENGVMSVTEGSCTDKLPSPKK